MLTIQCKDCRKVKDSSNFYRDRSRIKYGLDNRCKDCAKTRGSKQNLGINKYLKAREYMKKYAQSKKGKEAINEASKRAYEKYKNKMVARAKLRYAVKKGLIIKEPCFCGEISQGHHNRMVCIQ